ncbi:hypothetical protein HKD37_01G001885 [Glycine soja]
MPRGSSGPSLFRIDDGSASGYRDIGVAIVSLGGECSSESEARALPSDLAKSRIVGIQLTNCPGNFEMVEVKVVFDEIFAYEYFGVSQSHSREQYYLCATFCIDEQSLVAEFLYSLCSCATEQRA